MKRHMQLVLLRQYTCYQIRPDARLTRYRQIIIPLKMATLQCHASLLINSMHAYYYGLAKQSAYIAIRARLHATEAAGIQLKHSLMQSNKIHDASATAAVCLRALTF